MLLVHSDYSFCEGLAAPEALAATAARHGLAALALTDRGLTGAVEFYTACRAAGVRPVLGLDLPIAAGSDHRRVHLLAQDLEGWASLCRLSSAQLADDAYAAGLPFDQFAAHVPGLLCLAAGDLAWLGGLRDLFGDRLYAALADPADATTPQAAHALRLPLAAAPPIYYLTPEQADLQATAAAIRLNTPRAALRPDEVAPPGAHFPSPDELAARFAASPAALETAREAAGRCRLELPLGTPHYPDIALPDGASAADVLRQRAEAGARRLYGAITSEIHTRLEHELSVISARGYAPLFLIMAEILDYARATGVPVSSRGSAASSLVAHCLDITSPDPLRLNLYFERFLNPARSTPPDIDTDLCSRRRDRVIQHVFDRYGYERCALVGTINRFRERSALRETAKAFGLPPAEVSQLVDLLPERWGPPHLRPRDEAPFAALARRFPAHRSLFEHATALLERPHHLSLHPGGVVITPGPVTNLVPTFQAAKGLPATQLDLEALGALGLIKIDLLGIRGLSVIADVAEALAQRRSITPALAVLDAIPDDDAATRELVRTARTIGCFQIESPGMRATLKEVQAQSVDDLMTALALYRPGPLTGGLKDAFVRRHLGREPVQHIHPALAPLLADTYGVILYQEQVLRIAHELAGLSLADADLLRRAMSHFDPGKQMQSLKERFIAGAEARSGVPPAVGERVWELMAAFAGYGFPKAHAASYAQVAWRAAWCKAHHPAEFMAAVLANWGGYYRQRVYLTEARRLGLALRPPHVNHAGREFSVVYQNGQPVLYMGLDQVRDLTGRTIEAIQRERPFSSLQDFLARVDPRPQEAEALVKVGALEGLGAIPALLRELKGGRWERGQMALFGGEAGDGDDWTLAQKVAAQEELLEASVIAHPLELAAEKLAAAGALNTVEAASRVGQRVRVAGMRQIWRRGRLSDTSGDYTYFMSLEDLDGMLEVILSGDVYRRCRAALTDSAGPFVVEGVVERDPGQGEPTVRAEKLWRVPE